MHKGDQVMLTRSSWWQQQLIPRRLREDLVVMALLHRLLEIRQRQGGGTESAKDKRNERSSLVIRRAKPLRGICALHPVLGFSDQARGCVRTGEWSPAGGKGIYLSCSVEPGSYMAPSSAFCQFAWHSHHTSGSTGEGFVSWPLGGACRDQPCDSLSTPNLTQKLCAVIYSSSLCQGDCFS